MLAANRRNTLGDLPKDIVLRVVSHCSLEDAGYLSITEQSLYKVVTPLLPMLCDLTDLQLILCHPAVHIDDSLTTMILAQ